MKLKECKGCYYEGRTKCLYYNEEYKKIELEKCIEGFKDPYEYNSRVGELCRSCWYYQNEQCIGNEIAKENCIMGY